MKITTQRFVWKGGVSACVALAGLLVAPKSHAFLGGPGLTAWVGNYGGGVSQGCLNDPEYMPSDRQWQCGQPMTRSNTATGEYTIQVDNAAPMLWYAPDEGYTVLVQAVGNNVHCYEKSTAWDASSYSLTSVVRCVNPSGQAVNSQFVWSYRADNTMNPQSPGYYRRNFGYARVKGSNAAIGHSQTFSTIDGWNHQVTATRTQTGRYTVAFQGLNPQYGEMWPDDLGNVIVQRTCDVDTAGSCPRSVCIPYSWAPGNSPGAATTVNVRCYDNGGSARDTDFRVFVGTEGHDSATVSQFSFYTGGHFAWVNYSHSSSNTCYSNTTFPSRSMHETATEWPAQVCRSSLSRYRVVFDTGVAIYHHNDPVPLVSSRATGGVYCNPHQVECNSFGSGCNSTGAASRVFIRCYSPSGSEVTTGNVSWNLGMFY